MERKIILFKILLILLPVLSFGQSNFFWSHIYFDLEGEGPEPGIELPTVITNTPSEVFDLTADISGNVTNDGGATVTERGFVWNTTGNPTVSDNKVASGSGTGIFQKTINLPACGETYYIRAYATNSKGTAYGEEKEFTTTSLNFSNINLQYSVMPPVTCIGYGQYSTDGSEVSAKLAVDYHSFLFNLGIECQNNLGIHAHAAKMEGISVGSIVYSTTVDCEVISSIRRNRWYFQYISEGGVRTYKIYYIDNTGTITTTYYYEPQPYQP